VHTRIPIHKLISQLPILLLRLQRLPFLSLQRILTAPLGRTERSRQPTPDRLLPRHDALVVRLQQYPHGMHDGVCAGEKGLVGFGFEDVGLFPCDGGRPWRGVRGGCDGGPGGFARAGYGCYVPAPADCYFAYSRSWGMEVSGCVNGMGVGCCRKLVPRKPFPPQTTIFFAIRCIPLLSAAVGNGT